VTARLAGTGINQVIAEAFMNSTVQKPLRRDITADVHERADLRRVINVEPASREWGQSSETSNKSHAHADGLARELSRATAGGRLFLDLVSVGRRVLGDEDLARDAVQEALLSLWLGGSLPENVRGWLKGAVIRRSLHLARTRYRRQRREERAVLERRELSERDDPWRSLEREELGQLVMRALLLIAPEFREVLLLSLDDEMDYASMAEHLGVPIGTVRSRLNRSRKALRTVLLRTIPEEYRLLLPGTPGS
jgi:RNA polymerase sigma-70 factor (ECF subfamily)